MQTGDIFERIRATLADRYDVEGPLGEGGMATVYRARDLRHERPVAIKVLRPELAAAIGPERFQREIHVAAQLQHPNVLPLHDSGEADGLLYYVMPLVEGRTLRDLLTEQGPLPLAQVLRIGRQLADGLASAHSHGVVHRDVKPANILLSEGQAVLADFGLALSTADLSLTEAGSSMGTPLYSSPEQTGGQAADARSDVYSTGCVLHEMVVGTPPFLGRSTTELIAKHRDETPDDVCTQRPDAPASLAALVKRCLDKDPSARFADGAELGAALDIVAVELETGGVRRAARGRLRRLVTLAALLLAILAVFLIRALDEAETQRWIDEQAIPDLETAATERRYEDAFQLAQQVTALDPDHLRLAQLWDTFSGSVDILSEPPGALVTRRPIDAADDAPWIELGTTPVHLRLPHGFHRLRFELPGHIPSEIASHWYYLAGQTTRLAREGEVPDGMVFVPGGTATLNIPGLDHLNDLPLGSVLLDRYEVTNARWKVFMDAGGYADDDWWTDPMPHDGETLSLDEARVLFVDASGQTGPATWFVGDFPDGQDDHPVAGISWFEARAFCRWSGRELPTLYHWNRAAETRLSQMVVPKSNFDGEGLAPVGSYPGVTAFGLSDMAGNVREWCRNATSSGERVILGGGHDDLPYMFLDFFAQDPWDRSPTNGLRTSVDHEPVDASLLGPLDPPFRDFSKESPVSDEVFAVYRSLYDYDPQALRSELLVTDDESPDFRAEKVAYDLPYGERGEAWFYVPKDRPGPFPTVVYFPGSNAIHTDSSDALIRPWFEFMMKAGYAVIHPIYKGTYERGTELDSDYPDETNLYREHVIWWGKDFRRAVDYLESRPECDTTRLAYFGASWGGAMGPLMVAIEPRIKVAVLYVAGMLFQHSAPEVDVLNYVPRVYVPVLMLNGRYDHFFPVETAQQPLYDLLGTPAEDKHWFLTEEGLSVPHEDRVRETLAWFGKYL
jgi:formylglycine-generating enzyme required for sulfatase activity/dienelactone hydrolase